MNYTKEKWEIKRLPVTGGLAIYAGDELIAAGVEEDNVQLIASAPDLYEACKLAEDTVITKTEEGYLITYDALRKIKKALAKAEGK